MKKILLLNLLFLMGCSANHKAPINKSGHNQFIEELTVFNENVTKPINLLASQACLYNKKHNQWPDTTGNKTEGVISQIRKVSQDANSYEIAVKLSALSKEIFLVIVKPETPEENYKLKVKTSKDIEQLRFSHGIPCDNEDQINNLPTWVSLLYKPALKNLENTNNPSNEVNSFSNVLFKSALCILLKLDTYQCS